MMHVAVVVGGAEDWPSGELRGREDRFNAMPLARAAPPCVRGC